MESLPVHNWSIVSSPGPGEPAAKNLKSITASRHTYVYIYIYIYTYIYIHIYTYIWHAAKKIYLETLATLGFFY
jgi:hypothetical protein